MHSVEKTRKKTIKKLEKESARVSKNISNLSMLCAIDNNSLSDMQKSLQDILQSMKGYKLNLINAQLKLSADNDSKYHVFNLMQDFSKNLEFEE